MRFFIFFFRFWFNLEYQIGHLDLVGAKSQEDFLLSKNERSAVGARVGQTTLGGRLSEVGAGGRGGTFSKIFY